MGGGKELFSDCFSVYQQSDSKSSEGLLLSSDNCQTLVTAEEFAQMLKRRQRENTYTKVLHCYHHQDYDDVNQSIDEAKAQILSYEPGWWMERDYFEDYYNIPQRTTLVLVGPKASGKSSLINRISTVFNTSHHTPAPARAQVSANGVGTQIIYGYTIPKVENSRICLYDTPGLTAVDSHDETMLKTMMTEGLSSTQLLISRDSVKVNFVIFVVSAIPVLRSINVGSEEDKHEMDMLARRYNYQHLSIGDDKPVVVMTHGDLLSSEERVMVRTHLGDLLAIPPVTLIFDIPESLDSSTDLAILEMLKYSIEHAEKNFEIIDNDQRNENQHKMKSDHNPSYVFELLTAGTLLWALFWILFSLFMKFMYPGIKIRGWDTPNFTVMFFLGCHWLLIMTIIVINSEVIVDSINASCKKIGCGFFKFLFVEKEE